MRYPRNETVIAAARRLYHAKAGALESQGLDVAALVAAVTRWQKETAMMKLVTCLKPCTATWLDTKMRLDPGDLCLMPPGIARQLAAEGKVQIMTERKGDT